MMLRPWEKLPENMRTEEVRPYYEILAKKRAALLLKRVFDVAVSAVMLAVLSPFFLILALVLAMVLCLCACTTGSGDNTEGTTEPSTTTKPSASTGLAVCNNGMPLSASLCYSLTGDNICRLKFAVPFNFCNCRN